VFELVDAFFAFIVLGILIAIARSIRQHIGILRSLFIPSSIVAGVLALLCGPQVLGAIVPVESPLAQGLFPETMRQVWSQSPGIFINVVFATLFLGEAIPSPREIWRKASPQVAFGQTLAWGQYVVGLLLTLLILTPLLGLDPIAGALIEIAFEGGHGTAAGMAATFDKLGFPEGAELALGLATVGIVSGIVSGTILSAWGRRKGHIAVSSTAQSSGSNEGTAHDPTSEIRAARARLMRDMLIDPLSLNLGFVAIAIAIGWLLLQGLISLEAVTWGRGGTEIMTYVPLFPMALVGGLIFQLIMVRLGRSLLVDPDLMKRIAGVALDVTIVTALASISLQVLGENFIAFLILSIAGIVWNIWAFLFLGPRLLPSYWFERGIGDVGQSMGVTATGIVLLRMVDPQNRSGAFESFAYKQLFFEPIVGGGLFTAAAPALIVELGSVKVLILTGALLAFWIIFGLYNFRQIARRSQKGF
jgi:ESS family glutamate:Na+ symporter